MEQMLKKLSVLTYPISKDLFTNFIGSEVDLREVIDRSILEELPDGLYELNIFSEQIQSIEIDEIEKREYEKLLVSGYYNDIIQDFKANNHSDAIKYLYKFENVHYHLLSLHEYECSFEITTRVARKYINWGYRDLIQSILRLYKRNMFKDEEKWCWIKFYRIYSALIPFEENIKANDNYSKDFDFLLNHSQSRALMMETYNLLGIFYERRKKYSDAQDCWNKGISIINKSEDETKEISDILVRIYCNKALNSIINERYEEAEKYLVKADSLRYVDLYGKSRIYYRYASLYNKKEELDKSYEYLNKAQNIADEQYIDIELAAYSLESRILAKKHNFIESFMTKKICVSLAVSLYKRYFYSEFFDCLNIIKKYHSDHKNEIIEGIKILEELFSDIQFVEEAKFFKVLKSYLEEDQEYKVYMNSIRNLSLKSLLEKNIEELSKHK